MYYWDIYKLMMLKVCLFLEQWEKKVLEKNKISPGNWIHNDVSNTEYQDSSMWSSSKAEP